MTAYMFKFILGIFKIYKIINLKFPLKFIFKKSQVYNGMLSFRIPMIWIEQLDSLQDSYIEGTLTVSELHRRCYI